MKKFIEGVSKKAGRELLRLFLTKRKYSKKSKHEIVTAADLISEKLILSQIKKKFPGHQILSEEAGMNNIKSDYLWIVDPLDGTTNFSFGNPLFSICIALTYKKKIIAGAVSIPVLKEFYYATKGQGACLNGKKIHVSKTADLKSGFITFCHGSRQQYVKEILKYYRELKLNFFDARQLGSAGIEMAYIAGGRTDVYFAPGTNSWDVAAGVLIVREAGGKVTNFKNQEWQITDKDILATNGVLHNKFYRFIKNA